MRQRNTSDILRALELARQELEKQIARTEKLLPKVTGHVREMAEKSLRHDRELRAQLQAEIERLERKKRDVDKRP